MNVTTDPPPTVRILTPASGTTFVEGSVFTVVVDATDNGAVISTELAGLVNGQVILPPSDESRTIQVGTPIGATQFTLIAFGDRQPRPGRHVAPVALTIETEPAPTISFVTPVEGDTLVGGSTIRVVLEASDDVSVGLVQFGAATALTSPPYEFDMYRTGFRYSRAAEHQLARDRLR